MRVVPAAVVRPCCCAAHRHGAAVRSADGKVWLMGHREWAGCSTLERCNANTVLGVRRRLTGIVFRRGYNGTKLDNNLTCEIMNVVYEEAMESYNEDIILELRSNTVDDMEENIDTIKQFVDEFRQRRQGA